ncbi:MAG TPA: ester cyclase [Anaerolineales bacterium]|nr:ester cyclase [Anaerolineales bacterium]
MSVEQNKAAARSIVEGISRGDTSIIDELFTQNYEDRSAPPGIPPGREGTRQFLAALRSAFPDFKYTLEDEIAEGDTVVHRLTGRGTMQGEFLGMPPTGKQATWQEIHIGRFEDGKIAEHWATVDQMGMLQQLGLMPAPGQGSA